MKIKKRYIALLLFALALAAFLFYYNCIRFDAEKVYHQIDQTKFAEKYPEYEIDYYSAPDAFYLGRQEMIHLTKKYTEGTESGDMVVLYGHSMVEWKISYRIGVDIRPENTGELVARGEKTGKEDVYSAQFDRRTKEMTGSWGDWRPQDRTIDEFNVQQLEMMDYLLEDCKKE